MRQALVAKLVALAVLSCGAALAKESADFDKACAQIKQHDCQHARQLLTQLAQKGHAKSEVLLGMMYEKGAGVKQDLKQAEQWFKKAAVQNDAEGQTLLGMLMLKGPNLHKRHDEAVRWLHLAADRGSDKAKKFLDSMPGSDKIQAAWAARQSRVQARRSSVVKGAGDIRTSWKGYSALAQSMDEVVAAAAEAH